jgi:HK97 family phage major capsid protein
LELASAIAQAADLAFIDPANAGVSNVMPKSITNGATPIASSGSTVAQIDNDLKAMLDQLNARGGNLGFAVWVMSSETAVSLSLKRGTSGAPAYPGVTVKGGELLGLPALVSPYLGDGSSGNYLALLDASQVALADEDQANVSIAENATVQMDSSPSGGATTVVSLFQTDSAAIRVERFLNWRLRRAGFVSVLSGLAY